MKRTFLTAFALLSLLATGKAEEKPNPVKDTTAVKHLNLSEVKISASRVNAKMKDLPQKVDVITSRVIEQSSANNMANLLKSNGSVDILQYPGVSAGIGIRGFAPSTSNKYSVLLINGKPAGTNNIAAIDLSNVEKVEILKGPFSSQYGSDAMGGVINIVTKESTGEIKGGVSLQYGSFQTTKGNINVGGAISDLLDFDISYSYNKQGKDYKTGSHNFYDKDHAKKLLDPTTYGERMENSKFQTQNVSARLGLNFSENWKLNLNGGYYKGKDIETPGSFWHIYGMNSKDIKRYSFGFDLTGKQGVHNITFSPFYSNEENKSYDVGSDNYGDSENIFKSYGFQLKDAIQLKNHILAIGIDNNSEKYETLNYSKSGTSEAPYQPDYKNVATGIFSQFQMKFLNNKLNASFGLRGDNIKFKTKANDLIGNNSSSEDYWVLTKNIGLKYEVIDGLSIHTSWGDAFLAPTAFQVAGSYVSFGTTVKGNPDLDPEKSNTWDLGFAYNNFKKGINFDITYFDTYHKDKIVNDYPKARLRSFKNADKAFMNGLEIVTSYDFGALKDYDYSLRVYLNYSHIFDATVKIKQANGTYSKSNMLYVRDNTANFGVEFDNLKGFSTRLNARYIGHRYEKNYMYVRNKKTFKKENIKFNDKIVRPDIEFDKVYRHPVSYVFDYSAKYTFKDSYTLGLTVSNLLDENYTEKDGYNMPGRSFMVKVGYKF